MAETSATGPGRCLACRHFFITHHQSYPYGCRVLGFKSPALPCLAVRRSSGQDCLYFQAKAPD